MRVLLDVSQGVYEGTGSGRYVAELVKAFLRLDFPDIEYLLFGSAWRRRNDLNRLFSDFKKNSSSDKLKTVELPFPPKILEILWNKLHIIPIEMFSGEYDVYHSSDWTQAPGRFKKVTTVHDVMPFIFPDKFHHRIVEAHKQRMNWIEKEVDAIIVDALSTKEDLIKFTKIKSEKIYVIPLACDDRYFDIGKKKIAEGKITLTNKNSELFFKNLKIEPDFYILAVGTLEPRKNIENLINAYQMLDSSLRKKYPLVIVGKKAWEDKLSKAENVFFTGYVSDEILPELYSGAHCFVMPSLYEGFGLPVLEAMASASAVVCSNASSLPEVGGDDVHYIEDPRDPDSIRIVLEHILESEKAELDLVVKNAYNRAKQFSWERTARETIEVYRNILRN